jgi:hypothetical protein
MKPQDDPWLKNAHENAETIDREMKKLLAIAGPIRENRPVITKYQDFWNQAKKITALFKELKPLAQGDRDLLWNQFNTLCGDVKEKQKGEYGSLESLSRGHFDEIMRLAEQAMLLRVRRPIGFTTLWNAGRRSKKPAIVWPNSSTR